MRPMPPDQDAESIAGSDRGRRAASPPAPRRSWSWPWSRPCRRGRRKACPTRRRRAAVARAPVGRRHRTTTEEDEEVVPGAACPTADAVRLGLGFAARDAHGTRGDLAGAARRRRGLRRAGDPRVPDRRAARGANRGGGGGARCPRRSIGLPVGDGSRAIRRRRCAAAGRRRRPRGGGGGGRRDQPLPRRQRPAAAVPDRPATIAATVVRIATGADGRRGARASRGATCRPSSRRCFGRRSPRSRPPSRPVRAVDGRPSHATHRSPGHADAAEAAEADAAAERRAVGRGPADAERTRRARPRRRRADGDDRGGRPRRPRSRTREPRPSAARPAAQGGDDGTGRGRSAAEAAHGRSRRPTRAATKAAAAAKPRATRKPQAPASRRRGVADVGADGADCRRGRAEAPRRRGRRRPPSPPDRPMDGARTRGQAAALDAIAAMVRGRRAARHPARRARTGSARRPSPSTSRPVCCARPTAAERPCRACRACRMVDRGGHPDLHRLGPAGPGRQVVIGGPDAKYRGIRDLIAELALMPGRRRAPGWRSSRAPTG